MQELVITQTIGGVIHIHLDWPTYLKGKGVYFVKKDNSKIPEAECGKLLDYITCGDVHSNILGKKNHHKTRFTSYNSKKHVLNI